MQMHITDQMRNVNALRNTQKSHTIKDASPSDAVAGKVHIFPMTMFAYYSS